MGRTCGRLKRNPFGRVAQDDLSPSGPVRHDMLRCRLATSLASHVDEHCEHQTRKKRKPNRTLQQAREENEMMTKACSGRRNMS